jgi:hypothetical protein
MLVLYRWAQHREWFWPRKDSDNRTTGQLCWHNASLVQFVIANVQKLLRSSPNATIVTVAQEDNGKYCNDSEAQRIIVEEGTAGGPLLRAVNTIAQAIEQEFPQVSTTPYSELFRFICVHNCLTQWRNL